MVSCPPDDPFVEGSIVRIKLENFVTYVHVEFRPGPHLNVVAAPNGCGKSTIVNAICLGLAGKTKFLGRAAKPEEFIRHGCDHARIEIEIKNGSSEKNYTIVHDIHRNGSNNWQVNERTATQKSVEELVARMNIQVGNLCQFLPQDKVADFSKMNSIELLENTQKAVGSKELLESHDTLKQSRGEAKEIHTRYRNLGEKLETEKAKNARLEQDVRNYEERQRHLEHVELLGKKRAWLAYEEKRKAWIELKEKKKKMHIDLAKKKKENAPLEAKLKQSESELRENEGHMQKVTDSLRKDAEQAASRNRKIDALTEKMTEVKDELDAKREEEEKRKRKLAELRKQVTSLQNQLAGLENQEDVQPEIDNVNREKQAVMHNKTRYTQDIENLRMEINRLQNEHQGCNRELQRMNDTANQKLDILRQRHRQSYEAVMWLRENKHRFKGVIHEPIMTVITIKDERHAKYVENCISMNDMRLFVCEESADMHLFMRLVRDEQNLSINCACEPRGRSSLTDRQFKPNEPIANLAKYGFKMYVRDMFDAPESVMLYLLKGSGLHNIPVGDRTTKNCVDQISREKPKLGFFFSENDTHRVSRSRYTGNVSTTRGEIRPHRLLSGGVDMAALDDLTQTLARLERDIQSKRGQTRELADKVQKCEVEINDCNNRKKELQKKRDQRSSFTQQITLKQNTIKRHEDDARDIEQEEIRASKRIQDINLDKCKLLEEMKSLTSKCAQHSMSKVKYSLYYAMARHATAKVETEHKEQLAEIERMEAEHVEVGKVADQAKAEARQLIVLAQQATGTKHGEELAADIKNSFSRLPDNLQEIDELIHATQARADCTFETGENVMTEYRNRERDIARMEEEFKSVKRRMDNYEQAMDEARQAWLEPLRELISRINKNFSYFFKELKCAGEVDLEIPENGEDYDKYGIQIKVKFRDNESMRVLSAHSQSGGEKSVSTVLYMMSLQELTRCPFRVVDEINQGMDAFNERKVYEMMVKTACERSTSQYFLLTPKLLPDLQYNERTTVLTIFNGPAMVRQQDWNLRKFLRRRSRLEN